MALRVRAAVVHRGQRGDVEPVALDVLLDSPIFAGRRFRRIEPRGNSWTPSFEPPIRSSLMWVYEGQTQHWGNVLSARSGLWTVQQTLDALARAAATYDNRAGRRWRPTSDTTRDPIIASRRPLPGSAGSAAKIGVHDGSYATHTYDFDEVVRTLAQVAAFDWSAYLIDKLESLDARAPLEGLTRGGYRLVYRKAPSDFALKMDALHEVESLRLSIGVTVGAGGKVHDVNWESPAFDAGLTAGSVVAVNGRAYDGQHLKEAVVAAEDGAVIELLVKSAKHYRPSPSSIAAGSAILISSRSRARDGDSTRFLRLARGLVSESSFSAAALRRLGRAFRALGLGGPRGRRVPESDALLEDRADHLGVDGTGHRVGDGVFAVADVREVSPQLFHERDELGDLLLGDEVDLKIENGPVFGVPSLTILRGQDHGGRDEGRKADEALKPLKRWRVEGAQVQARREHVVSHPDRGDRDDEVHRVRSADGFGQSLHQPLMFIDARFGLGIKREHRFEVLPHRRLGFGSSGLHLEVGVQACCGG
jgi:hypothetical protein